MFNPQFDKRRAPREEDTEDFYDGYDPEFYAVEAQELNTPVWRIKVPAWVLPLAVFVSVNLGFAIGVLVR